MTEHDNTPELVINARPQISISYDHSDDDVTITTASIGRDFDSVEHESVVIPGTDLNEVMNALQLIRERRL